VDHLPIASVPSLSKLEEQRCLLSHLGIKDVIFKRESMY
jgi:hypothetical protein